MTHGTSLISLEQLSRAPQSFFSWHQMVYYIIQKHGHSSFAKIGLVYTWINWMAIPINKLSLVMCKCIYFPTVMYVAVVFKGYKLYI